MSKKLKDQLIQARLEADFWFITTFILAAAIVVFGLLQQQGTPSRRVDATRNPTPNPTIAPEFLNRSNLLRYCNLSTTHRGDPYCDNGKPNGRFVSK